MAEQSIQNLDVVGMVATYAAADGAGDTFPANAGSGRSLFIHVRNTDTAAHDVIVVDQQTPAPVGADAFDADVTVNVAAGGEAFIGPVGLRRFMDDNGMINLDYSAATGMEIAVLSV